MEYELGQYIRLRYDGFIGKTYKPREVYVESSDTERTMMSALCVAAGFYPVDKNDAEWYLPVNWQPVSVHTVPQHIDNVTNASQNFNFHDCPNDLLIIFAFSSVHPLQGSLQRLLGTKQALSHSVRFGPESE